MTVFFDCIDVSKSEFVCGKAAENVTPQLHKDMKFWEEAVGVVDPPRAKLRKYNNIVYSLSAFSLSPRPPPPSHKYTRSYSDTIKKSKTIERLAGL